MIKNYISSFLIFILLNLVLAGPASAVFPRSDSSSLASDTNRMSISLEFQAINDRLNMLDRISRQALDTGRINNEIKDLELRLKYIIESVNYSKAHFRYRLLKQNSIYLSQIKANADQISREIKKLQSEIHNTTEEVSQRISAVERHFQSQDVNVKRIYQDALGRLQIKWHRIDSINYRSLLVLSEVEAKVIMNEIIISDLNDRLAAGIRNFNATLLHRSEPTLFQVRFDSYTKDFFQNAQESLVASSNVLIYYLRLHWFSVISSLVISVLICFWLVFLARRKEQILNEADQATLVLKMALSQPYAAGILVAISFALFTFPNPPIVLIEMLWTLQGALLVYLLVKSKELPTMAKFNWTLFVILFRSVAVFNLFLQVTYIDRWLLLLLAGASLLIGVIFLMNAKTIEWPGRRRKFRFAVSLFILAELVSIIFNITGHFRLSVLFANTGVITMYTAVILVIFYDITTAVIDYQFESINRSKHKTTAAELTYFRKALKRYIGIFSVLAWIMIFLSITNLYDFLYDNFREFIEKTIVIGDFAFTLSGILVFCIIIWVSVFLSRVTNYISAKSNDTPTGDFKTNSLLLIKLGVITGGVLLAFLATGIPLDRLAIILGALGVGIGFGLQDLVNNLISGVMVVLEKPVKVGDFIEIESHSGTVTEIGIRASRIHTKSGVDVIVPNGELLSKHIVNWTLGSPSRSSSFSIIIDAASDLKMAKEIMQSTMEEDSSVLKNPHPHVRLTDLMEDAVEHHCTFWSNFHEIETIKSRILEKLQDRFSGAGIKCKNRVISYRI